MLADCPSGQISVKQRTVEMRDRACGQKALKKPHILKEKSL